MMETTPLQRFNEKFGLLPVFGMIHLAGNSMNDKIARAFDELKVFEEEGVTGAIIENYHGELSDVAGMLYELQHTKFNLKIGINILLNDYNISIPMAEIGNASFVQLDYVAGRYTRGQSLIVADYLEHRGAHPEISVIGGVWPKYYEPVPGSDLGKDLLEGKSLADAIAVTGEGTGKETPIAKITAFRQGLGSDYPLIVAAGLTPRNVYEQLMIADGAIVGSTFKADSNTQNPIERDLVREFMWKVHDTRKAKDHSYRLG